MSALEEYRKYKGRQWHNRETFLGTGLVKADAAIAELEAGYRSAVNLIDHWQAKAEQAEADLTAAREERNNARRRVERLEEHGKILLAERDDERELRKSGWAGWDDCKSDLARRDRIIASLQGDSRDREQYIAKLQADLAVATELLDRANHLLEVTPAEEATWFRRRAAFREQLDKYLARYQPEEEK